MGLILRILNSGNLSANIFLSLLKIIQGSAPFALDRGHEFSIIQSLVEGSKCS